MTPLGRSLHIPRDLKGRPIRDQADSLSADSFATVTTDAGRSLRADGGVFPDLVIQDDTLTSVEQNFLVETIRAEIPLTLRITEFALEQVRRAQDGEGPQELDSEAIDPFFQLLEEQGVPADLIQNPEVRDYLGWRVRMAFARRSEHYDHALMFQAERDRVLAHAMRFLEGTDSQGALFALVETEAALAQRAEESGRPSGSRDQD